jgi:hypothetical protein
MCLRCLVGVREAAHAGHDAEHVVVERIDADLRSAGASDSVQGHRELEGRLVNAGEVAGARRLVLLRAEREGVHVDTSGRGAAVVLVGLDAIEVGALALSEAVLAVELQLGNLNGVLALATNAGVQDDLREQVVDTGLELANTAKILAVGADHAAELSGLLAEDGSRSRARVTANGGSSRIGLSQQRGDDTVSGEVIGVVEGLGAANRREPGGGGAIDERVALDDPLELLDGVVEVQLDLVGGGSDGLRTSVLNLLDEVLVGLLGEAAALLSVQVHVVNIQRRSREGLGREGRRHTNGGLVVLAVLPGLEVNIDAHLVVLEGDERDRKAGVAAEPELEGDVEGLGRGAAAGDAGDGGLRRRAGGVQRNASAALEQNEVVGVADQGVERRDRAGLSGELSPDLHPVAVLAVDALAADLNLNLLQEAVADVVEPAEALGTGERNLGEDDLDVGLVHQVRVTVDHRRHALVEVRLTVEGNLNGLNSKVGVALVEDLPESDLGVARDIDILRTIRNELH